MSSVRSSDKSVPYFPLAGQAKDGYSNAEEATATCYCGTVQLAFPVEGPGLVSTFVERLPRVCLLLTLLSRIGKSFPRPNRGKITAQLTYHSHLRHLRGQENLSVYSQVATIASGHSMANHFCKTCGTLMYRVGGGFPGCSILRLGTVDEGRDGIGNSVISALRWEAKVWTSSRWCKNMEIMHYMDISVYQ